MSFENKISDKLNGVSMEPSSDIMNLIRKKRTPFYIFKNHLRLHKVRYGAVAILGLLAISAPFVLDTSENAGAIVNNKENSTSTEIELKNSSSNEKKIIEPEMGQFESKIESKDGAKAAKKSLGVNSSNSGTGLLSSKKSSKVNKYNKTFNSSDKNNTNDLGVNSDDLGNKNLTNKGVNDLNKKLLADKQREFVANKQNERLELTKSEPIITPKSNLEYLDNPRVLEDRNVEIENNGPINDLKKIGVNFIGFGAGYYLDHSNVGGGSMGSKMKESLGSRTSLSYGISIGLSLYKKWTLQTGVELYSRKENFSYLKRSENYLLKIDTVHGKIHIPGEPDKDVVRYDSSYYNDGNHQIFTAVNKTSYVEVPIVLSYNLLSNQKLRVGVNPGLRFGLLQSQSGLTLNETYSPVNVKSEGAMNQHRSVNLSAELGFDFDYRIAPGVNFFVQPKVRTGLGNLMDENAGFKKYNTSFGVFSGIRFQLN